MKTRVQRYFIVTTILVGVSALTACDQQVGVTELVTRTAADGTILDPLASCVLVSKRGGESVGGGGSGPDFATEMHSADGEVHYDYYIAQEANVGMGDVTPANGELAAELDADMEFFESGETKHIAFETYDGIAFEVFLWGQDDCEGDLPTEPPASE